MLYGVSRRSRLRVLQWLTVLVPAVCAGLYETVRHSLLAAQLPTGLGTLLAVALVLAISFVFARVTFGLIRRIQARLVERNRQLEALSRRVQRLAVIEERDRLAREMHDGIAQVLAYLLVRLDTIEGLIERGRTEAAVEEVRHLRDSGEGAYADVREAIAGLRVRPEAGAAGLAAALREYAEQFGDRTGVAVRFSAQGVDQSAGPEGSDDLDPAAELQLLRIAQEALANVRKHAGATRVDVRLRRAAGGWHLEVQDDGRGFDPAAPLPAGHQHFGLHIMRERAESLGGSLTVVSRPGGGTTVAATVPPETSDAEDEAAERMREDGEPGHQDGQGEGERERGHGRRATGLTG
jgi:signal transduction histidine kinase